MGCSRKFTVERLGAHSSDLRRHDPKRIQTVRKLAKQQRKAYRYLCCTLFQKQHASSLSTMVDGFAAKTTKMRRTQKLMFDALCALRPV
jgi:hypothetical protein